MSVCLPRVGTKYADQPSDWVMRVVDDTIKCVCCELQVHRELSPNGKALINSVSGEEASLAKVLQTQTGSNHTPWAMLIDSSG